MVYGNLNFQNDPTRKTQGEERVHGRRCTRDGGGGRSGRSSNALHRGGRKQARRRARNGARRRIPRQRKGSSRKSREGREQGHRCERCAAERRYLSLFWRQAEEGEERQGEEEGCAEESHAGEVVRDARGQEDAGGGEKARM